MQYKNAGTADWSRIEWHVNASLALKQTVALDGRWKQVLALHTLHFVHYNWRNERMDKIPNVKDVILV